MVQTLTLINYYNLFYYLPTQFAGDPTQLLVVDTGSSDTWARGTTCVSIDESCVGNKMGLGGTFTNLNFEETYGDGSVVSGGIYFGSPNFNGLSCPLLYYGNMTEMNGWADESSDGIVGLAQISSSIIYEKTQIRQSFFIYSLGYTQFGLYFNNFENETSLDSQLSLGGYDPSRYQGSITWIPTNDANYWQMSVVGGTVNVFGNIYPIDSATVTNIVFDTGSVVNVLPLNAINGICSNIVGCAYDDTFAKYVFPCTSILPNLQFNIGGHTWIIPGFHYSSNYSTEEVGDLCTVLMQENTALDLDIFGTSFFRAYYTAFDLTNGQFGYAIPN